MTQTSEIHENTGWRRRDFLAGVGAVGAAAALGPWSVRRARADKPASIGAEEFTFVHMTDMHVTPKRRGDKGYAACVESVRALDPRPAFALMGGDLAFDGNYTPKADFEEYIRLYKQVSDGLGIPYYNCMGNHDALGWSARRKVPADDPDIGKKMIMDRLEWEKSYYSFDFGGWHFVVLDCIHPVQASHGPTYEPRIGQEQLEWLAYDLGAAGDRPKVAVTHIAAFCNMGQLNGDPDRKAMDGHMVLWDTKELRTILERHKVKALLQGHSHRIEQYCMNDVWYLTSAAVSGAWWAGSWVGSPPGYTVFRAKGDTLTWEHRSFAWEPQLEPDDKLERANIAALKAYEAEQRRLLEQERAGRQAPASQPAAVGS
ncbi:MAG: metallophosphoesterase [Phycisphaerae bacterium]|nr:metallophosphoesterase [Phycisphaerae bacterium]